MSCELFYRLFLGWVHTMKTNIVMPKVFNFLIISAVFANINAMDKDSELKCKKRQKEHEVVLSKTDIFNMSEKIKESNLKNVLEGYEKVYDDAFTNVTQTENYIDRVLKSAIKLDEKVLNAMVYDAKILSALIEKNYDTVIEYSKNFLDNRIGQIMLDQELPYDKKLIKNFWLNSRNLLIVMIKKGKGIGLAVNIAKAFYDKFVLRGARLCKLLLNSVNIEERQDIRDILDPILIDYVNLYLAINKLGKTEKNYIKFEKIVLNTFIPYLKKYNNLVVYPLKNEI